MKLLMIFTKKKKNPKLYDCSQSQASKGEMGFLADGAGTSAHPYAEPKDCCLSQKVTQNSYRSKYTREL